jgi:DNA-binding response OmpR family regulator
LPIYVVRMASSSILLCIHRDPTQLSLLTEHGYELATATTGSDGLRLFMSRPVDAVVLDYHLGLVGDAIVADEIKRVRPDVPIVMLVDQVELPVEALKSVDALVVKSDGPYLLLATVHFVLNVKPAQHPANKPRSETPVRLRRTGRSRGMTNHDQANICQSATDGRATPFSPEVWRSILDGKVEF